MQDKQETQCQRTPKSKWKTMSDCPDIWIRVPRHKWPKSWSSLEDPSRSSCTKFVWSSTCRTVMVMRRNEWTGIAIRQNETTQRLYRVSTPCLDDHQFKEEKFENSKRFVRSGLTDRHEMSIFGAHRPSLCVRKETCTSSHKMDESCWQTLGSFDFFFPTTRVITGNIVMWEILHSDADWDQFKIQTLREALKNHNRLRVKFCVSMAVTHLLR